jgi:hypothetical protein
MTAKSFLEMVARKAAFLLLTGWFTMLLVGALHSSTPAIPSVSYGEVLAVFLILNFARAFLTTARPVVRGGGDGADD